MLFTKFKVRLQLPVMAYLGVILGLGMVLFFGLSTVVKEKGSALNQEILQMKRNAAQQELATAIKLVVDDLMRAKTALLNWDEVRQQLANPSYYDYWRRNRLRTSSLLPKTIDGGDIYDRQGMRLQAIAQDTMLPLRFPRDITGPLAKKQRGAIVVLYGFSVTPEGSSEVLGYVLLSTALQSALKNTGALHSIDPLFIADKLAEGESVSVDELINYLTPPTTDTPAATALSNLVTRALQDFLAAGAVLSVLILLVVVSLFVRPLQRLSVYVDDLRQNEGHSEPTVRSGLAVTEIEKTYQSLYVYHAQLAQGNDALRQSETRLRTILDNVPDGVLSIDNDSRILSCNPAACKLFGLPADALVSRLFIDLLDISEGESPEIAGIRADGSRFPAETTFSDRYDAANTRIIIVRDITERKNSEARLVQLANYDPLTGLPNRTLMRDRLMHAIQRARRNHTMIGLIFLDLDRFKNINDTLGHQLGDALLKQIAERLIRTVRDSDTVARLGGDEFTIIIENVVDIDKLSEIATHLLENVSAAMQLEGRVVSVSTSMGITLYPMDGEDSDRLIKNADTAMYRAKELGRNNYQYFTEEMNAKAMERLELEHALRLALQNNEFILYYQPRMNIKSNTLVGVEALIRWQHPQLGMIPPGQFISIMEDTAMIIPMGEWVLRTACTQLKHWQDAGFSAIQMAVNVSARQFQDKGLVNNVRRIIEETGVSPFLIELEITESLLMDNQDTALPMLNEFHAMGISIAIDDFGTGYSSLSYLLKFPIDIIKIDRSFIAGIPDDKDACAITTAIIALSKSMQLKVTAEGIATQVQEDFMRSHDCDEGQGYLYAMPMPAEALLAIFNKK